MDSRERPHREESLTSAEMKTVRQAGAIVYRTDGDVVRILLVRAKKDPTKWVFPKGHLQGDESHAAAALREAHEEAGVIGISIALVAPPLTFTSGNETVTVEYFLVLCTSETESPEGREKTWVSIADAYRHLEFPDARELLSTAGRVIQRATATHPDTARSFGELMLHEYDHVAQSLLANEESGEKRVTFFLTLASGIGAAIGFLLRDRGVGLSQFLLIALALLSLFVLGYVTLVRVVTRNVATDRYQNQLSRIRQYFVDGKEDGRARFLAFDPFHLKRRPARTSKDRGRIVTGGWVETVTSIEAIIAGSFVAFVLWALMTSVATRAGYQGELPLLLAVIFGFGAGWLIWLRLLDHADELYSEKIGADDGSRVSARDPQVLPKP
jgi:8-oxo-dGTP pyrophosphatase MutT (NUDIX family)